MQYVFRMFGFVLLAVPVFSVAQTAAIVPSCSGAKLTESAPPKALTFAKFDLEFRSALQQQDAAALALLIHFPLRVNTSKGTIMIPDAASLAARFQEIFTPAVRREVLATTADDYICRYDKGVAYQSGRVWVSEAKYGFAVWSVNVPDPEQKVKTPRLTYTCQTDTHRITIEELASGAYRYRSWNKPKPLTDSPDVDISTGKQSFGGTGICAVPVYTFTNGNIIYEVDAAIGCTDGKEPKEATGRLSVSKNDKQITDTWCY